MIDAQIGNFFQFSTPLSNDESLPLHTSVWLIWRTSERTQLSRRETMPMTVSQATSWDVRTKQKRTPASRRKRDMRNCAWQLRVGWLHGRRTRLHPQRPDSSAGNLSKILGSNIYYSYHFARLPLPCHQPMDKL